MSDDLISREATFIWGIDVKKQEVWMVGEIKMIIAVDGKGESDG